MEDLDVVAVVQLPGSTPEVGYRQSASHQEQLAQGDLLWLASFLGISAYDARMRLAGIAPWFVARARPEEAERMVAELRERGFRAVRAGVRSCRPRFLPPAVAVRLGADGLEEADGRQLFAYEAVRLIVVATLDQEHGAERVEQVVVGRGGRGEPTTVEVSRFQYERQKGRALYFFQRGDPQAFCIVQGTLAAPSIPARTSRERIDALFQLVKGRCSAAVIDERFAAAPRKRTSLLVSPTHKDGHRDSTTSNANETDLAAYVLAMALDG